MARFCQVAAPRSKQREHLDVPVANAYIAPMDFAAIFIAIGVAHAALLSLYAAAAARRKNHSAWLAALFALLAVAVTAILITHRTEGAAERSAVMFEEAAAWFVGPVLFIYVSGAVGQALSNRMASIHLAVAAGVVVVQTIAMLATPWWPMAWAVVLYQVAYSFASAIAMARRARPEDRSAKDFWWPLIALVIMFAVHAGQALRFAAPDAGQDAVPLIGALAASMVLLGLLLTVAGAGGQQRRYARSSLGRNELDRIHSALLAALDGPPALYLQLDLNLAKLSAAAGVQPHHASQALSEIGETNFYDLLTERRVREARRRLLLAENANVAVEAIGLESGFRSRSAFYAAFKGATGASPAEFRRQGPEIVSRTAGAEHSAPSKANRAAN